MQTNNKTNNCLIQTSITHVNKQSEETNKLQEQNQTTSSPDTAVLAANGGVFVGGINVHVVERRLPHDVMGSCKHRPVIRLPRGEDQSKGYY